MLFRSRAVLQPNIVRDLQLFREDIENFLGSEVVRRYYFQKGVITYQMRYDKWLHEAVKLVNDTPTCKQLLKGHER